MNPDLGKRASGRTTRQADALIQLLFDEGKILVRDHHDHPDSCKRLAQIILNRLDFEHRLNREHIIFGQIRGFDGLRGHGFEPHLYDATSKDAIYYVIQFRRAGIKPNIEPKQNPVIDYGVPKETEDELPDADIVIPGILHPKGFDPSSIKQVPVVQKTGSRYDKFN